MTLQKQTDFGLIKQMRCLHTQAEKTLSEIAPMRMELDNATLVQVWRSTQTSEIKGKYSRIITYNN